ncbi:hypothetical protein G3M48_008548 [Beauveria asiatica]|uniref:Uncharacterized protein n=1 Tax=Beauveria asiatica TaxID=1069075 RepID=A0AAW0RKK8_9HYPO
MRRHRRLTVSLRPPLDFVSQVRGVVLARADELDRSHAYADLYSQVQIRIDKTWSKTSGKELSALRFTNRFSSTSSSVATALSSMNRSDLDIAPTGGAVTTTVQTPAPATKASALPVAEDALGKAASANKLEERISQGKILVANTNMQNQVNKLGEHTATILSGVASVIKKNPVIEKDLIDITIAAEEAQKNSKRIQTTQAMVGKNLEIDPDSHDSYPAPSSAFENTPTKVILRSGFTPINGPAKKENGPAANATNNKTKSVFDVDEDDVAGAALGNIFYVK